jgi:hypothetical protein
VTEFIYRYNAHDRAQVFLSFQLDTSSRAKEVASVLNELERGGMTGHDISDDEMAKSHARYLIGGASDVPNERIFRFGAIHSFSPSPPFFLPIGRSIEFEFYVLRPQFTCSLHITHATRTCTNAHARAMHATIEFPERPGALRKFLSSLRNMGWNISLFHYRNHGAGAQRSISPHPSDLDPDNGLHHACRRRTVDLGKVLAGIQAPEEDSTRFTEFLRELGYPHVEETQNVIYKRYLRK